MKVKAVLLVLLLTLTSPALWPAGAETPAPSRLKPALLVMDVQNLYLPYMDEQDVKRGMPMINHVIALFRANGFPVVRIYHTDTGRGPAPGTEAFEFPDTVRVTEADAKIIKNFPSAFKRTQLDALLREKGVNAVFLVGLSAVGCVLATYHGADEADFTVFMVKNALLSHDATLTKHVYEIADTINYPSLKLLLETARAQ